MNEVERYHEQCYAFHKKRMNTADAVWHKLLKLANNDGGTLELDKYSAEIAAEALQYYMRHTE